MKDLTPLTNNILFVFDDEVKNGHFVEKRFSGIIVDIGKNHSYSAKYNRTGRVLSVGPQVNQVQVGDHIVIQNMMWSDKSLKHNGQQFWMTNEKYVIGKTC